MFWQEPRVSDPNNTNGNLALLGDESKPPSDESDKSELKLSDYLKNLNIDELMNFETDADSFAYLHPEYLLGNVDEIKEDLLNTVLCNDELLDEMAVRITSLDQKIEFLKAFFFDDSAVTRRSKIKENRFYIPQYDESYDLALLDRSDSVYMTEFENDVNEPVALSRTSTRSRLRKSGFSTNSDKKTLDTFEYRHFEESELTEFPGYLEAPQLLNSITAKMKFKPSFLKYWQPIIRSEASCAILLDAFWWFYLRFFRPDSDQSNESYKYFCRLAESYAALLYSIDISIRDHFFQYYADFLSQAIYLAFFRSFPDSKLQFDDEFKENLSNTVHEWVLGIRPIKDSYLNWVINDETRSVSNKDFKASSTNRILQKIENLETLLNELGDELAAHETTTAATTAPTSVNNQVREVKFRDSDLVEVNERTRTGTKASEDRKSALAEIEKSLTEWYNNGGHESHVVGEGAVVEKIGFNPKGQSVLINHYMKLYKLRQPGAENAYKITRSEITQNPPQTAPTYRDLLFETLQRSKSAGDQFKKKMDMSHHEMARIESERRRAEKECTRIRRSSGRRPTSNKKKEPSNNNNNNNNQNNNSAKSSQNNHEMEEII